VRWPARRAGGGTTPDIGAETNERDVQAGLRFVFGRSGRACLSIIGDPTPGQFPVGKEEAQEKAYGKDQIQPRCEEQGTHCDGEGGAKHESEVRLGSRG
jgi:hypothetical protein